MKMKLDIWKFVILIILVLSTSCFAGTYSGGDGNELTPYLIGSPNDWTELVTTPSDWGKHFTLIDDINLAGANILPVGNSTTKFTGVFDGNSHVIYNGVIYQPSSDNVGLFGYVYEGEIKKLGAEEVNVIGNLVVGGLCGCCEASSITKCYTTGEVTGGDQGVGGLCGFLYDGYIISNCYSKCEIHSYCVDYAAAGGLVGFGSGAIFNCYSIGKVTGSGRYVGGLCAMEDYGSITNCFWDIQTSGQTASAGGGTGLPTSAVQSPEPYLGAFWDFAGEILNGTEDIWAMPPGGGYPVLAWQLGDSNLPNEKMSQAIAVTSDSVTAGTTVGSTGLDLTLNGYNDSNDVWYYFDCDDEDLYTIKLESNDFDTTVAVFDDTQKEIVFNDDFYGGVSLVILKAEAAKRHYIRVSGHDGQTGSFTLTVTKGAIQAIHGDLNYDGRVNFGDFSIFADQWLYEL
jgi:hypothetical protein